MRVVRQKGNAPLTIIPTIIKKPRPEGDKAERPFARDGPTAQYLLKRGRRLFAPPKVENKAGAENANDEEVQELD